MSIRPYHGNDKALLNAYAAACEADPRLRAAYSRPTQRQFSKWLQRRGAAWNARVADRPTPERIAELEEQGNFHDR